MDLNQSICKFLEAENHQTVRDQENGVGAIGTHESKRAYTAFGEQTNPRDGMSAESAVFQIGKCNLGNGYKVRGVKNKGRYFTAKVLDKNGSLVNEIMVDKLNGRVKFMR